MDRYPIEEAALGRSELAESFSVTSQVRSLTWNLNFTCSDKTAYAGVVIQRQRCSSSEAAEQSRAVEFVAVLT